MDVVARLDQQQEERMLKENTENGSRNNSDLPAQEMGDDGEENVDRSVEEIEPGGAGVDADVVRIVDESDAGRVHLKGLEQPQSILILSSCPTRRKQQVPRQLF